MPDTFPQQDAPRQGDTLSIKELESVVMTNIDPFMALNRKIYDIGLNPEKGFTFTTKELSMVMMAFSLALDRVSGIEVNEVRSTKLTGGFILQPLGMRELDI
jgi:hypothetical protein